MSWNASLRCACQRPQRQGNRGVPCKHRAVPWRAAYDEASSRSPITPVNALVAGVGSDMILHAYSVPVSLSEAARTTEKPAGMP